MVRTGYALLMVLITAVLVGVACICVSTHQQTENNRKFCSLLKTLDTSGQPATTARGREIQPQIHALRLDLGCRRKDRL